MWIKLGNILTIIKQLNNFSPIVLLMKETCNAKTRSDYSVRTQNLEPIVCFTIKILPRLIIEPCTCEFVDECIYCAQIAFVSGQLLNANKRQLFNADFGRVKKCHLLFFVCMQTH